MAKQVVKSGADHRHPERTFLISIGAIVLVVLIVALIGTKQMPLNGAQKEVVGKASQQLAYGFIEVGLDELHGYTAQFQGTSGYIFTVLPEHSMLKIVKDGVTISSILEKETDTQFTTDFMNGNEQSKVFIDIKQEMLLLDTLENNIRRLGMSPLTVLTGSFNYAGKKYDLDFSMNNRQLYILQNGEGWRIPMQLREDNVYEGSGSFNGKNVRVEIEDSYKGLVFRMYY